MYGLNKVDSEILVFETLGAFGISGPFPILIHGEKARNARTAISSVCPSFVNTNPLPMVQMRWIPRFQFLGHSGHFGTSGHFPILIHGRKGPQC